LGIEDAIVSPTFILLQEYLEGRIPLYHFDLYRLQSQEVEALHPDLYWSGLEYPPGLVAIEWADRLIQKPQDYLRLSLQLCPTAGRQAQLEFHGTVELTDVDFDPAWLLPLEEKNLDAE
jgi:tRNA threonylcarbamoyladenosine biosynthesis protein TsaE